MDNSPDNNGFSDRTIGTRKENEKQQVTSLAASGHIQRNSQEKNMGGQATEEYKAAETKVKNLIRNAKRTLEKKLTDDMMVETRDHSLHTSIRKQIADLP